MRRGAWFAVPLLLASLAQAQPAPGAASPVLAALLAEVDGHVQAGYDQPERALAALAALALRGPASATDQRVLLLGRGLVAAAAGRGPETADALAALTRLGSEPLAAGDAALVRATLSDTRGDTGPVLAAAQEALKIYRQACPADPGCDHRSSWRAIYLLARHDARRGHSSSAREHALAAAELARAAGDSARQALALAAAADLSNDLRDSAAEQRLFGQAQRLARLEGSPALLARIRLYETKLLQSRTDTEGARLAAEAGIALARQANSPRMVAVLLTNLSDIHVKAGRPRAALQVVEQALAIARQHGDRRTERVLMHNAALARVALGQTEVARRTVDELLAAYAAAGAAASEVTVLREFADAFAAAGDLATALNLYHRERKRAAEIMTANRDTALAELRARYDREAQQRQLDQLGRESTLMTAQLANRAAMQKVWIGSAVVLALATLLVALLYKRVRQINLRLAHNHAFLRAQSQRDPLTGLANRRGLHDAAQAQQVVQEFAGALLLVDIDHFKHVNDGHGHAAGDLVLVEVARRLAEVVRADDLVVRWGGEEFLIYMPGVGSAPAQAQALAQVLAQRVLQAVGGEPVALPQQALRVSVSVGYGCFPLPPASLPLTLEQAINLADMALYTAKSQGRNRAIGINSALASDASALRRIEADFDQAWHEGRVTLQTTPGPQVAAAPAATRPAALTA